MAATDGSEREGLAESFEKSEGKANPRSEKKEKGGRGGRGGRRGGGGGGREGGGGGGGKNQRGNLSGRNPSLCSSTIRILLHRRVELRSPRDVVDGRAKLIKNEKESDRKILETKWLQRGS